MIVLAVWFFGNLLVLQEKEDVSTLIQKLDSDKIAERNQAYDKLLELAKKDKSVLEIIKKEVDRSSNSFNTKYMLKRILNEVEKKDEGTDELDKQYKDKKSGRSEIGKGKKIKINNITLNNNTISLSKLFYKPTIGIKGISVSDSKILDVLESDFNTKYANIGEFLKAVGLDSAKGVFVLEVEKDSPAENLLQGGDILLKIDDEDIKDVDSLKDILERYEVGQTVKLEVLRNKVLKRIELKLSSGTEDNISDFLKRIELELFSGTKSDNISEIIKKLEEIEKKVSEIEDNVKSIIEGNVKSILEKLNDIQEKLDKGGQSAK